MLNGSHRTIAIAVYLAAALYCAVMPGRALGPDGDVIVNVYPFGEFALVSVLLAISTGYVGSYAIVGAISWSVMLVTISLLFDMLVYTLAYRGVVAAFRFARLLQIVVVLAGAGILAGQGAYVIRQSRLNRRISSLVIIGFGLVCIGGAFLWLTARLSGMFAPSVGGLEALAIDAIRLNRAVLGGSVVLAIGVAIHLCESRRVLRGHLSV